MFSGMMTAVHLLGFIFIKGFKTLLSVSLEDPAPSLNYCFLAVPPLSLHFLLPGLATILLIEFALWSSGKFIESGLPWWL